MESIKKIYKIGNGPSSSHTMGPKKAAAEFKTKNPQASKYKVTLYGSLAATGVGHLTDKAIIESMHPTFVELVWEPSIVLPFHSNGMKFEALDANGNTTDSWTTYSIGGGTIANESTVISAEEKVYKLNKIKDILDWVEKNGKTYWEYVAEHEDSDIWEYLAEVWEVMQQSVRDGLLTEGSLPGGLHIRRKARSYHEKAKSYKPSLQTRALIISYALAVAEHNACGGRIVTTPTCGSSGVLPGVLYHLKTHHDFSDKTILEALATAGLFANVIKTNASISGAEVGCQGEIGSACAIAAAAANQLFGGSPSQIEYAAEMGLEHHLGLTCDPVCGLVQVPCIERNAFAALRALDATFYSMMSDGRHFISFDKVVETMKLTGKDLPSLYKETSEGGLAIVGRPEC